MKAAEAAAEVQALGEAAKAAAAAAMAAGAEGQPSSTVVERSPCGGGGAAEAALEDAHLRRKPQALAERRDADDAMAEALQLDAAAEQARAAAEALLRDAARLAAAAAAGHRDLGCLSHGGARAASERGR